MFFSLHFSFLLFIHFLVLANILLLLTITYKEDDGVDGVNDRDGMTGKTKFFPFSFHVLLTFFKGSNPSYI